MDRANEVERLNAHLQAQVRARGAELDAALAKLAAHRPETPEPGFVLADRFEIGGVLGAGGMGVVYEGTDRVTGEKVAIKVVHASSAREIEALQRFVREAASVATVAHPAIVRMLHVDVTADGVLFQVQELVPGEPLARSTKRPWEGGELARLGAVLADALAAAHAASVVHRDVKPSNVVLMPQAPGLKLVDFGIAKLWEESHPRTPSGTRSGMMLGTPAFMAPEQIDGARDVTDRADVYATGVTLFLLGTGRYPFEGFSATEVMLGHKLLDAPDPREHAPSLPRDLADAIRACLAKDPATRPAAAVLARDLGAIADREGAPPLDAIARARRDAKRAEDAVATVAEGA